jgi:hypothetical protein
MKFMLEPKKHAAQNTLTCLRRMNARLLSGESINYRTLPVSADLSPHTVLVES